jgi:hypothetical protein
MAPKCMRHLLLATMQRVLIHCHLLLPKC